MDFKVVHKQSSKYVLPIKLGVVLCIAILMTSCSSNKEFYIEYTGIFEGSLGGQGLYLPCIQLNYGIVHKIEFGMDSQSVGFSLILPINAKVGTYELKNSSVDSPHIYSIIGVILKDGSFYNFSSRNLVSGDLEITYFSEDRVEGNFQAKHMIDHDKRSGNLNSKGKFKAYNEEGLSTACMTIP